MAHAAEEVITGKRKRGRKRKGAVQKADKPEPEQEVAHTTQKPEQEVAQPIEAPVPWRAPVACMY